MSECSACSGITEVVDHYCPHCGTTRKFVPAPPEARTQWGRLVDAIAESVWQETDEELRAEILAEGKDPEVVAREFKALLLRKFDEEKA